MITTDYHEGDLAGINKQVDVFAGMLEDNEYLAARSIAYTIKDSETGAPLCCLGCCKIYEGVYHAWMITEMNLSSHALALCREVKSIIGYTCKRFGILRLNTQVDPTIDINVRFAQMMGFRREYLQKNAGPCAKGKIMGMVYWPRGARHG